MCALQIAQYRISYIPAFMSCQAFFTAIWSLSLVLIYKMYSKTPKSKFFKNQWTKSTISLQSNRKFLVSKFRWKITNLRLVIKKVSLVRKEKSIPDVKNYCNIVISNSFLDFLSKSDWFVWMWRKTWIYSINWTWNKVSF